MLRVSNSLALVLAFAIFFLPAPAVAEKRAPFGLKWGHSITQSTARGMIGKVESKDKNTTIFKVKKFPINPRDTNFGYTIFIKNYNLQKIIWHSKIITGDSFGDVGKTKFAKLERIITNKYGPPSPSSSMKKVGIKLFKKRDEFYQCLGYTNCGIWAVLWKITGGGIISLEINASGRPGEGWLTAVYEGPHWIAHVKRQNSEENRITKEAF